jgi:hypothetical protein
MNALALPRLPPAGSVRSTPADDDGATNARKRPFTATKARTRAQARRARPHVGRRGPARGNHHLLPPPPLAPGAAAPALRARARLHSTQREQRRRDDDERPTITEPPHTHNTNTRTTEVAAAAHWSFPTTAFAPSLFLVLARRGQSHGRGARARVGSFSGLHATATARSQASAAGSPLEILRPPRPAAHARASYHHHHFTHHDPRLTRTNGNSSPYHRPVIIIDLFTRTRLRRRRRHTHTATHGERQPERGTHTTPLLRARDGPRRRRQRIPRLRSPTRRIRHDRSEEGTKQAGRQAGAKADGTANPSSAPARSARRATRASHPPRRLQPHKHTLLTAAVAAVAPR